MKKCDILLSSTLFSILFVFFKMVPFQPRAVNLGLFLNQPRAAACFFPGDKDTHAKPQCSRYESIYVI